jgi:hypothetical protein
MRITVWSSILGAGVAGILAACGSERTSLPLEATAGSPSLASAAAATIRIRCEKRLSPARSRISVDGNNLSPLIGTFSARVRSGGVVVTADAQAAIGDEVEFDFDSNPNNIAAGATPIPADYIVIVSGPDVQAQILDASGAVVVGGGVDCQVR